MNRFGAFLVHLAISVAVLAVILYFVFFWWYPDFFFATDGGGQGLRIVLLVDLVLGPVLTLVVFDRTKPELQRDLAIIGTLQAVCLAAGTYVVWSERPLALVYSDGMFSTVTADDFAEPPDLSALPGPYPKRVHVALPEDPIAQSEVRTAAWQSGRSLRLLNACYEPYASFARKFDEAIDLQLLRDNDPHDALERWHSEHGDPEGHAFFPFGTRYGFQFLGVSRSSGEIVDVLEIPYQPSKS